MAQMLATGGRSVRPQPSPDLVVCSTSPNVSDGFSRRTHRQTVCLSNPSRRLILGCGWLLLAVAPGPKADAAKDEKASPATVADGPPETTSELPNAFRSEDEGFQFSYPSGWLVAFDRTREQEEGTLVLVGDFVNVDTLSIQRNKLRGDIEVGNDGAQRIKEVVQGLVAEQRDSPAAMNFQLLGSGRMVGDRDGVVYWAAEYTVELCRGQVEEGLGGTKICRGPNAMELETVTRHHLIKVARQGEVEYIVNASAPEDRWEEAGEGILAAVNSFGLA